MKSFVMAIALLAASSAVMAASFRETGLGYQQQLLMKQQQSQAMQSQDSQPAVGDETAQPAQPDNMEIMPAVIPPERHNAR